jgi:hypothetical protein
MANVWRAESNDPTAGGVIVEWPSGVQKVASWRQSVPIADTHEAAKVFVTSLVQERIDSRNMDDVERTNIASLVAAVQKHVSDWNDALRTRLHSSASPIQ